MKLEIKKLTPTAKTPTRGTEHASCFDLYADSEGTLAPGARALVKTGLVTVVPPGYEVQIRSRSGLALKQGVAVLNSPATIDADYRGELGIVLINHGDQPFVYKIGDRVAQMGVYPVCMCPATVVEELSETVRGAGGFGHTGV